MSTQAPVYHNPEFDQYAEDYDAALQQGLSVSGESKDYFAEGRVKWLRAVLASLNYRPSNILDFGCGTGSSTPYLLSLPGADSLVGVEVSPQSVKVAQRTHGSARARFSLSGEFHPASTMNLAFCNGVFHHIPLSERAGAVKYVFEHLKPGGFFALWENNPWNPGTRYVMSRIPFDKDAITLSFLETQRLLRAGGFEIARTDFLFIFPRSLSFLRPLERLVNRLPLGAQYMVLGRKKNVAASRARALSCGMRLLLFLLSGVGLFAAEIHTLPMEGVRNPYGVCIGPDSALYVCDIDNHVIWKFRKGQTSIVAGSRQRGYAGDGGPATSAQLNEPYEVRFDGEGNMYFVEMRNHLVRRVSGRDQTISTIAGTGQQGYGGDDAPAIKAQLNQPHSIQLDGLGNLYICDIGNHRIRKVDLKSGTISTLAGTGERKSPADGAKFAGAPLNGPRALDFDEKGDLWLALREGNAIYRFDMKAGTLHFVVTNGLAGPKGITVGRDGIYFADTESHSARRVTPSGKVELAAGIGRRGDGPDGDPLACALARPHGIFAARDGTIYIGDSENNKVRTVKP